MMVNNLLVFTPLNDRFQHIDQTIPSYIYEGYCQQTGAKLTLPRNQLVEAIANELMRELDQDGEGKMYGILLVETVTGERGFLKAFSGLLAGQSQVDGWVESIDKNQEEVILSSEKTLRILEDLKQELIKLQSIPERSHYQQLTAIFHEKITKLKDQHQENKKHRHQQRLNYQKNLTGDDLIIALNQLNYQSQIEGIERRKLKSERDRQLQPLAEIIEQSDRRIREIKQERKTLSQQLQKQMHNNYLLLNFLGQSATISQIIFAESIPSGTGDCCAPKLLNYAAKNQLKPIAMAEFWWGKSIGDKIAGEFYGACVERCQPLMGFLLSGVNKSPTLTSNYINNPQNYQEELPIIYEDQDLIAINKPSGLLSVPGRYYDRQDSVFSRLCGRLMKEKIWVIHRLDQDTSGIILFAKNSNTYQHLIQQWQTQTVKKVYEALVNGDIDGDHQGLIDLPLWSNPHDRPRQEVNWEKGKPSLTKYRVLKRENNYTRVEFIPLTGRTHQIRVHSAQGLGYSILGDRLYGNLGDTSPIDRLYLHAKELQFMSPRSPNLLTLNIPTPF